MINRNIFNELINDLDRREITVLIGPRQVGKTTLLKALKTYCDAQSLPVIGYRDLEQPVDSAFFARSRAEILEELKSGKGVLLIDEFHYIPNATQLFKAIYDGLPLIKIFATGSSSVEMHRHLKESLAGRRRIHRIFPMDFREYLQTTSVSFFPSSLKEPVPSPVRTQWREAWDQFIGYGSLPGVIRETSADEKKRVLLDYVATYIQKDVKALLREEDILTFNKMLILLAHQSGSLLNESNIANDLKYSPRQVRKDLDILQQTYVLDLVMPYFRNRATELKKTPKAYLYDLGIRNILLSDFSDVGGRLDKGSISETAVYQELKKHLQITQQIFFWRTKQKDEVDFVLVKDRKPLPVEVKGKLNRAEIPGSLRKFLKIYPESACGIVLNDDLMAETEIDGHRVYFAPHAYASLIPGLQR